MSWPTVAELADFLQTEIPDADPTASLLLDLAKGIARAEARQDFDAVTDDQVILDANGTNLLLLPQGPVTDVGEVLLDEGDDAGATELDPVDDYEWSASGHLRRLGAATWGTRFRSVTVTYDHGYTEIPEDVRAAVLAIAARAWTSPVAVRQETIGSYSVTYLADAGAVVAIEPELRVFRRYRSEALA